MNPISSIKYIQSAYRTIPIPTPLGWMVTGLTGSLRFYQSYKRVEVYSKIDWNSWMSAELANVMIDCSETSKSMVQMLAICLNVQELIEGYINLAKAYQNVWIAFQGTYPYYKKERWNEISSKGLIKEYSEIIENRLKQIIRAIFDLFKKIFVLSSLCLTNYDLINSNDLARYDAVRKLCLDPNQHFQQFIRNKTRLVNFLEKHQDFINPISVKNGFENVEDFKNQAFTNIQFQENAVWLIKIAIKETKTFTSPIFNSYNLIEAVKSDREEKPKIEKRVPDWMGQEIQKKKKIIQVSKKEEIPQIGSPSKPLEQKKSLHAFGQMLGVGLETVGREASKYLEGLFK